MCLELKKLSVFLATDTEGRRPFTKIRIIYPGMLMISNRHYVSFHWSLETKSLYSFISRVAQNGVPPSTVPGPAVHLQVPPETTGLLLPLSVNSSPLT